MSSNKPVRKLILSKQRLGLFCLIVAAILITIKFIRSTDPKLSLNAWENVHEWRADGECADCHSRQEHVVQNVDFRNTLPIPAAQSHTEQFRRFTHGKKENLASHNCRSCHQIDSCKTCHAILPETHSSDFTEPTGHSAGSLRHGILAKTSPSSCLACHRSFVETCTTCHTSDEVLPWQKDAAHSLSRWNEMLNFD